MVLRRLDWVRNRRRILGLTHNIRSLYSMYSVIVLKVQFKRLSLCNYLWNPGGIYRQRTSEFIFLGVPAIFGAYWPLKLDKLTGRQHQSIICWWWIKVHSEHELEQRKPSHFLSFSKDMLLTLIINICSSYLLFIKFGLSTGNIVTKVCWILQASFHHHYILGKCTFPQLVACMRSYLEDISM